MQKRRMNGSNFDFEPLVMFEAPHCEQQAQKLIDGQAEPCTEQPHAQRINKQPAGQRTDTRHTDKRNQRHETRIAAAAQAPAVNHLRYLQEHDDRDEIMIMAP